MITNCQLVNFCEQALKKESYYMWGTYGKLISKSLILSKAKQYPKRYSTARQQFLLTHVDGKSVGCDCVGLIKWALWTDGDINGRIRYQEATDRNTTMLYEAATLRGPMAVLPEIPGLIVYRKGHVGVYVGKGKVIECTLGSRGDGIVKTDVAKGEWTHWLKIPEVMYVEANAANARNKVTLLERMKHLLKI